MIYLYHYVLEVGKTRSSFKWHCNLESRDAKKKIDNKAVDKELSIQFTCGFKKLKNKQEHVNCFRKPFKRFKWLYVEMDSKSNFYERNYPEIFYVFILQKTKEAVQTPSKETPLKFH